MNSPLLILVAKCPVPGTVKTRFYPNCSYETAAKIAMEFIKHTLEIATSAWPGEVKLLLSPNDRHEAVQKLLRNTKVELGSQCEGDLGLKLETALRDGISAHSPTAVMGCDIPAIKAEHLRAACAQLRQDNNVLGPTSDGGFYFMGLQHCPQGLLQNMQWSHPNVTKDVIARAKSYQIRFDFVMECLQDVDTWEDFEFATTQFPKFKKFLNQQLPVPNSNEPIQVKV